MANYTKKFDGYVYLIHMKDTPYYKIGISTNNPSKRLSELQVSTPYDLVLIESFQVPNPRMLEREIHRVLAHCRVRGEWFEDTDGDVLKAYRALSCMALFDMAYDMPKVKPSKRQFEPVTEVPHANPVADGECMYCHQTGLTSIEKARHGRQYRRKGTCENATALRPALAHQKPVETVSASVPVADRECKHCHQAGLTATEVMRHGKAYKAKGVCS